MTNLLLAFREGGRLAAVEGRRLDNGDVQLDRAAYSGCPVEDADGCPKNPSWRVTAERVFYDADAKQVRFQGAYLELFGKRVLPLPGPVDPLRRRGQLGLPRARLRPHRVERHRSRSAPTTGGWPRTAT